MLGRMARQVFPPQIKKHTWTRANGTEGARYEVRVDVGKPDGTRQQTRRRFATLREAKDYLAPILGYRPLNPQQLAAPVSSSVRSSVSAYGA